MQECSLASESRREPSEEPQERFGITAQPRNYRVTAGCVNSATIYQGSYPASKLTLHILESSKQRLPKVLSPSG